MKWLGVLKQGHNDPVSERRTKKEKKKEKKKKKKLTSEAWSSPTSLAAPEEW